MKQIVSFTKLSTTKWLLLNAVAITTNNVCTYCKNDKLNTEYLHIA